MPVLDAVDEVRRACRIQRVSPSSPQEDGLGVRLAEGGTEEAFGLVLVVKGVELAKCPRRGDQVWRELALGE